MRHHRRTRRDSRTNRKSYHRIGKDYKDVDKEHLVKTLQNHVKQVTAPYKYPRVIEFVDELPKTISGKIRRVEIRNKDNQKS